MGDKKDENFKIDNSKVDRFFVYGTLRDDDDSDAMWTVQWTQCCKDIIEGYRETNTNSLFHREIVDVENVNAAQYHWQTKINILWNVYIQIIKILFNYLHLIHRDVMHD